MKTYFSKNFSSACIGFLNPKRLWWKNIIVPLFLILPILLFAIPRVTQGTDNLGIIYHFGQDEGSLIEFAGKTYSKGVIPLEYNVTYPQLFYYLAGVFLFPFTLLKGVNYQMIAIVLRIFNTVIISTTVVFLYFFCLRFFKSILVAILSCLLLLTTPGYISWIINSRPHLLEIGFLLATLYFCFRMAEQYRASLLISAIIFAGLATAAKFGGIFMIPVIWISYIYGVRKNRVSELISSVKAKRRIIYAISSVFMTFSILIPTVSLVFYPRIQNKLFIFGIRNFDDFLLFRNFRILLLLTVLLFIGALFWFLLNRFSNKFASNEDLVKKYSFVFSLNKSLLVLCYISFGIIGVFLICNPSYIIYPFATIKEMTLQIAKSTMSTSYDPGLAKPIFDKSGLIWFKMLFDNEILNIWFGLLFLWYIVYEFLCLKRNLIKNKTFLFQRGLLLFYCVILLLALFLFLAHRPHHYLLPIGMVMGILISFGIFDALKQSWPNYVKWSLGLFLISPLIFGFYIRGDKLASLSNNITLRSSDSAIEIGEWLKNSFDKNTIIWKDAKVFYTPPHFKKVFSKFYFEDIKGRLSEIKEINAEVLIITGNNDPSLKSMYTVTQAIEDGTLADFELIRKFKYKGALSFNKQGQKIYKEVYIYSKK